MSNDSITAIKKEYDEWIERDLAAKIFFTENEKFHYRQGIISGFYWLLNRVQNWSANTPTLTICDGHKAKPGDTVWTTAGLECKLVNLDDSPNTDQDCWPSWLGLRVGETSKIEVVFEIDYANDLSVPWLYSYDPLWGVTF